MKIGSTVLLALLTASLALPVQASAGNEADKQKSAKPVQAASSDCRLKSKTNAASANENRRRVVAERKAAGKMESRKVYYSPEAAKKHDRKHAKANP